MWMMGKSCHERDLLSPGFPSYPRGVKKSQTINPLALAPACRTGWMHQRNGAVCVPKPVCWRSACRILPPGSQSLLTSSRACLAPHHSSKALGSSVHSSHTNSHQKDSSAKISNLQPHMYPPARSQGNLGWG